MVKNVRFHELKSKLSRLEALYQRPGSDGEKTAAAIAIEKLRAKLRAFEQYEKPIRKEDEFVLFRFV